MRVFRCSGYEMPGVVCVTADVSGCVVSPWPRLCPVAQDSLPFFLAHSVQGCRVVAGVPWVLFLVANVGVCL